MKYLRNLFVVTVFVFICVSATAQSDTIRVLFVGNSFTYFWNVPQLTQAMAISQGVPIITSQSTAGGVTLEHHWKGERNLKTKLRIEEGIWDFVVLQNHSSRTIDAPDKFLEYGKKLGELARAHGAEPIYYMTWAYKSNPLMQSAITAGYENLAKEMNADYVPVGPIFQKVRTTRPDIELFFDDKHQNPAGTYIIALSFYKYLSGESVLNIPNRLSTRDANKEPTHLIFISTEDGKFYRQVVEDHNYNTLAPKK